MDINKFGLRITNFSHFSLIITSLINRKARRGTQRKFNHKQTENFLPPDSCLPSTRPTVAIYPAFGCATLTVLIGKGEHRRACPAVSRFIGMKTD